MKLKPRQSVRHAKYGWGTVLEHDGHQTTACFHTAGIKKCTGVQAVFEVVEHLGAKKKPGG